MSIDIDDLIITEFKNANKNNCELISNDLTKLEIIEKVIKYIENRFLDVQYISTYAFNSNINHEIELNFKLYLRIINGKDHFMIIFETNKKHMDANRVIIALYGGELINCIDIENWSNWNEIFG